MFAGLSFNGDTSKWEVRKDADTTEMFLKIDYDKNREAIFESMESGPRLCDCLKNSKYASDSRCKTTFKNRYGTTDPSMDQMRNDYNNCK